MNIHLNRITKVALALAGVAGLALAAETAQAGSPLDLNGTGSSSGRQFAGNRPVLLCDATPTPRLFVSSETIPERYEWQCTVTVSGTAYPNSRIRYSATKSSDAFVKQPLGAINTAAYLSIPNTTLCSGGSTTILGVTVEKYVCPGNMSIVQLPVHWGGSDVEANSINQRVSGVPPIPPFKFMSPPKSDHLTTDPKAVVPFAIMVGANVRKMVTPNMPLTSLTKREIYAIMTGNVVRWNDLGYGTAVFSGGFIAVCHRDPGSGALAALDEIIMLPKYWGTALFRGVYNASTTDMINCLNSHPNSIGYVDSDSVIPAIFPTGGPYQIQIDGQPVNTPGGGLAGLTALRCGRYIYWTNWNFVTRSASYQGTSMSYEGTPMFAAAGTSAALAALGTAMSVYNTQPNSNPLPDFWLSPDDMFVFKNQDRGPHHWFSPTTNSSNPELIADVCN